MKCSLGTSDFLEEISSLSHSIVFLYFFALITEKGFLISPCYSLELCIQMAISFLFSFAFYISMYMYAHTWIQYKCTYVTAFVCMSKEKCESCSVVSDSLLPGILQAEILEWVAIPFPRGSSQPRDRTQVFCIADEFFTSWSTREAQEYWSGFPFPSPEDLPDPGFETESPALQADSSPPELSGKPLS